MEGSSKKTAMKKRAETSRWLKLWMSTLHHPCERSGLETVSQRLQAGGLSFGR